MTMVTREDQTRYAANSRRYMQNAMRFMREEEVEKATEFLWGSMAAAIKAVAAAKGRGLKSHRDIRDYARLVAKELGDNALFAAYRDAEGMHSNFYESRLTAADIRLVLEDIRQAIAKLLSMSTSSG